MRWGERSAGRAAVAVALALLGAGCAAAPAPASAPPMLTLQQTAAASTAPVPTPDHVVVVVLENKDVRDLRDAPFLTGLAARSAQLTDAHAETHPSQPNYLALFSGDMHGVTDDTCTDLPGVPSLGGRLLAAGRTFTGFSEDLPSVGWTGCHHGDYARKHAPWVSFADVPPESNRPLSDLPADFSALPTVAFVTPNLCHDMHDCDVATGDDWMRTHIGPYADWAVDHNSVLVVTFDESESQQGANQIFSFVAGAGVRAGPDPERVDHYRILRTIEDMYGLAPLGHSADVAPITAIWEATR